MTRLNNRHYLKWKRKELRNNATKAEKVLWQELKHSYTSSRKFRRQHSIGNYILDFYCPEAKLCIELDGSQHEEKNQKEHDEIRTKYLDDLGIVTIRFKNEEVLLELEKVIKEIEKLLNRDNTSSPSIARRE